MTHPSHTAATASSQYRSEADRLKRLSRQLIDDYPDAGRLAYAAARDIVRRHTGKRIDPDQVWWHRFGSAVSSSRTFTGWQHAGTPLESMTLVELVMHRFSAQDQQAADELQSYGGFYTDGPQQWVFDERNEVPLLPRQVLDDFWALDFGAMFQRRIDDFWTTHSDTFCTLARTRFMAAAALALNGGRLSLDDFRMLGRITATQYCHDHDSGLRTFDIGGCVSSRIIRVVDSTGRQLLYLPGENPAFHVFANPRRLYEWVRRRLADPASRKSFEALFLHPELAHQNQISAFHEAAQLICLRPWTEDDTSINPAVAGLVNRNDQPIAGDIFQHLRSVARHEMQSLAHLALVSNTRLRKQIWLGYLTAFIHVMGPTAVLGWPLALTLVGAGVASLGLNIDQAINGVNHAQRKAGVIGSILNSIFILFNLPLVTGITTSIELLDGEAGTSDLLVYEVVPASEPEPEPVPLIPPTGEGARPMQGVQQTASGETWISLDGAAQRVRYSAQLRTWLVVDPSNPFAFTGSNSVRYTSEGVWKLLPPLRLAGGSPMQRAGTSASLDAALSIPSRSSAFWDIYMQLNHDEEERLSEFALARQKEVVNVREAQSSDDLSSDSDGEQVLVDAGGSHYRIFRMQDGRYVGGRVRQYTEHDENFNSYLRTGQEKVSGQVRLIEELASDLSTIGFNNDVTLYRGGSGARGTSGVTFRSGHIRAGDILVNSDFTSFSENPYVARSFASSQAGAPSYGFNGKIAFDETAIVFELPAERYLSATPIAPFAVDEEEAESLFMPGHYFQIQNVQEVTGAGYKFINVQIREVPQPAEGAAVYDLRTGEPFSRVDYATKLGSSGKALVDRFFPLPDEAPAEVAPPHP